MNGNIDDIRKLFLRIINFVNKIELKENEIEICIIYID